MDNICQSVIQELAREMAQHQLPVQLIIPAILTFSKELLAESKKEDAVADESGGYKLGSGILDNGTNESNASDADDGTNMSVRERALAAGKKRAREQLKKKDNPSQNDNKLV